MVSTGRRSTSGTYDNGNITGDRFYECGLRAPLQVSNSVANPGRKYYACPIRRCGWFRWAGPSIQHSDVGDDRSSQLNSNFKTSERVEKLHTDVVSKRRLEKSLPRKRNLKSATHLPCSGYDDGYDGAGLTGDADMEGLQA
ncbi:hypothetical protein HN51_039706 [Arachis hypogaea]